MRLLRPFVFASLLLSACAVQPSSGTVKLQFEPAAFQSDEFSTGPTDITVSGCNVPADIARFEVRAFSAAITDSSPIEYTVDDIDTTDCSLNILLPPNSEIEMVIKAFSSEDALVRKTIATIPAFDDEESVAFPAPLWPAKRLEDTEGGDGSATDLQFIEVMRQFDQFLIELAFDAVVFPASQGGPNSLNGFIELTNTDTGTAYQMQLDATADGMTLVELGSTASLEAEFEFVIGGLQIGLPYDSVGGSASSDGQIDAPAIEFAISLLDLDDTLVDAYPESGVDSLN